jgi:hypothetical protein
MKKPMEKIGMKMDEIESGRKGKGLPKMQQITLHSRGFILQEFQIS